MPGLTERFETPPVLFLVYNRYEPTQRVFDAIRSARPAHLYVAADGPNDSKPDDERRCEMARQVAEQIDWPCTVETLYRSANLGCRRAVSGAIDWFFANESAGIILEDDCLPHPSFFDYSAELLVRYRDDPRVVAIAGNGSHGKSLPRNHSYTFSRYNHVWGWASWARAWAHYDDNMRDWPQLRSSGWLEEVGSGDRDFVRCWREAFDATYTGRVDSWAYRWTYSCWRQGGLTALPSSNVVKNIGFGADATHTRDSLSWRAQVPLEGLPLPITHPPAVARDAEADRWMDHHIFGTHTPLHRRVIGPRLKAVKRRLLQLTPGAIARKAAE